VTAINNVTTLWTQFGTNVSLGRQKPPGRSQNIAASLILMGDWRDSVRSQVNEETGAVKVCKSKVARKVVSFVTATQAAMFCFAS